MHTIFVLLFVGMAGAGVGSPIVKNLHERRAVNGAENVDYDLRAIDSTDAADLEQDSARVAFQRMRIEARKGRELRDERREVRRDARGERRIARRTPQVSETI